MDEYDHEFEFFYPFPLMPSEPITVTFHALDTGSSIVMTGRVMSCELTRNDRPNERYYARIEVKP